MYEGDWEPIRDEGFNEVGGVSVKVVGMATDALQPVDKGMRDVAFGLYGVATVVVEILVGMT